MLLKRTLVHLYRFAMKEFAIFGLAVVLAGNFGGDSSTRNLGSELVVNAVGVVKRVLG